MKSTRIIQQLERDYKLTITPGPRYDENGKIIMPKKRGLTKGERERQKRTGKKGPRQKLQRLVDEVVAAGPQTAPQFRQRLEAVGVIVRPNLAKTGRLNGFSFDLDGVSFKASNLGDAYKWSTLQKRGVSYDPARDRAALERSRIGGSPRHAPRLRSGMDGAARLVERNPESLDLDFKHV